jgi:hypothetical protein
MGSQNKETDMTTSGPTYLNLWTVEFWVRDVSHFMQSDKYFLPRKACRQTKIKHLMQ